MDRINTQVIYRLYVPDNFVNQPLLAGRTVPVTVLYTNYTGSVSSSISLTCSLRYIINAYCIHVIANDIKVQVCTKNF